MRWMTAGLALGVIGIAEPAGAATIVVLVDPMTLDRRTLVLDTPGPDRLLMCVAPPGDSGCTELPMKRRSAGR